LKHKSCEHLAHFIIAFSLPQVKQHALPVTEYSDDDVCRNDNLEENEKKEDSNALLHYINMQCKNTMNQYL